MAVKHNKMVRVWFYIEADLVHNDFFNDQQADEWLENHEIEEFKREEVMVEQLCDCDNTQTRFYQDHGCCEHCFYL